MVTVVYVTLTQNTSLFSFCVIFYIFLWMWYLIRTY